MWQYILDNYFSIYGIIVAVAYVLWILVGIRICEKIFEEDVEWTEIESFFGVTVAWPVIGAGFLLFWPIVLPVAIVLGLFFGIFHLNKARIENKDKQYD